MVCILLSNLHSSLNFLDGTHLIGLAKWLSASWGGLSIDLVIMRPSWSYIYSDTETMLRVRGTEGVDEFVQVSVISPTCICRRYCIFCDVPVLNKWCWLISCVCLNLSSNYFIFRSILLLCHLASWGIYWVSYLASFNWRFSWLLQFLQTNRCYHVTR